MPESHKQWKSNYHILYSGQQHGVPFDFLKKCCKGVSAMKAVFTFKPIQVNLGTPFCINCNSIVVCFLFFVTFLEPYFTECVFHSYKIPKQKWRTQRGRHAHRWKVNILQKRKKNCGKNHSSPEKIDKADT